MSARCRTWPAVVLAAMAGFGDATPARAQLALPAGFRDTVVVAGLHQPVAFAFVPGPADRPERVLILEQKLRHLRQVTGGVPGAPMAEFPDVDWPPAERGVLSLAVDPRWPQQPYIYVHYTSTFGAIHLARFRMTGDLAFAGTGALAMDAGSRMLLLADVPDANPNHNGGSLRFAPDSMLLFSTGEDQQGCPAQDTASLGGKLLRLDVRALPASGAGPVPRALLTPADNPNAASPDSNWRLVLARGLRNPFRFHVDPVDGAVFIADVGQARWEEINRITGPANLGWPWYEGTSTYISCANPPPTGLTFPIFAEAQPDAFAIVSLGVYRAPAGATEPWPAEYDGVYFYADHYLGWVRAIRDSGSGWVRVNAPGQPGALDWGQDAIQIVDGAVGRDGALWYLRADTAFGFTTGTLRRIRFVEPIDTTTAAPGPEASAALRLASANPAGGAVRIAFTLPRPGAVRLTVHDAGGRRVRVLADGARDAGPHQLTWDGADAAGRPTPPGLYFARLAGPGTHGGLRIVRTR